MKTLKTLYSPKIVYFLVLLILIEFHSVNAEEIHHQRTQKQININEDNSILKVHLISQSLEGNSFDQKSYNKGETMKLQQFAGDKINNQQNSHHNKRIKSKFQSENQQSIKNQLIKIFQNVRLLSDCNIQGCSQCNQDVINICDECEDNYVLQEGSCYKPDQYPPNCNQAQKTGNPLRYHCTNCYAGYTLDPSDDTCKKCKVDSCSSCSNDTIISCDSCLDGYYLTESKDQCQQCRDNCQICNSSNDCMKCLTGYILYEGQYCGLCGIENCLNCSYSQSKTVCTMCQSQYLLFDNKCLSLTNSQNGTVTDSNYSFKCPTACTKCSFLNNNQFCQECQQGYGLNGTSGICIKCQNTCKSCDSYSSSLCTGCYSGYVLIGSSCTQCSVQYCNQCDPSNITQCIKCADNFYLHSSGKCYLCNDGCKSCDETGNCSLCSYGYHLFGYENGSMVCQSCISGCSDCEYWAGKCTECYPRFYITEDKTCSPCQQGCWKCNSFSMCIQCDESKIMIDNKCVDPVQNCKSLSNTGKCNQCLIGYKLNETTNECVYSLQSSLIDSNRYSCPIDSYLLNLQCFSCPSKIDNCVSCQFSYCLKCNAGYYLSNSRLKCNECTIDNCQQCKNSQICSKCKQGYFIQTDIVKSYHRNPISQKDLLTPYGKCLVCSQNCLTCQYRDNICTKCKSGYILTSSRNCITLNKFDFEMKINADFNSFASRIEDLKVQFVYLIQDDSNVSLCVRKKFIHLTALSQGSVNVAGYISATSPQSLKKTYDNFNTLSSGGQLNNGFSIISSKLSNYQTAPTTDNSSPTNDSTEDSSNNSSTYIPPQDSTNIVPIVVGIAAGVFVLIVVIDVLVYCFCCKKKKEEMGEISEDKKSSSTGQERESKDKDQKQYNPESQKYFNNPTGQKQQNWVSPQYYL